MARPDCPRPELLSEYLLGKVSEDEANRLEQHLSSCTACEATIDNLQNTSDTLLATIRAAGAALNRPSERQQPSRTGDAAGERDGFLVPSRQKMERDFPIRVDFASFRISEPATGPGKTEPASPQVEISATGADPKSSHPQSRKLLWAGIGLLIAVVIGVWVVKSLSAPSPVPP